MIASKDSLGALGFMKLLPETQHFWQAVITGSLGILVVYSLWRVVLSDFLTTVRAQAYEIQW